MQIKVTAALFTKSQPHLTNRNNIFDANGDADMLILKSEQFQ